MPPRFLTVTGNGVVTIKLRDWKRTGFYPRGQNGSDRSDGSDVMLNRDKYLHEKGEAIRHISKVDQKLDQCVEWEDIGPGLLDIKYPVHEAFLEALLEALPVKTRKK